jgi:hypothetical protein
VNAGLGRLVTCAEVPPRRAGTTGDKGCSSGAEEGNVVGPRPKIRGQPMRGRRNALAPGDASFARSGGPCTSIVAQLTAGNRRGVTHASRHRGRASLGNQERTGTGVAESGRSAARRVSPPARERAVREKRKTVAAVVPSRSRESGSKCPHVVAVAEVVRRRLASNTLARSAPKRVAV